MTANEDAHDYFERRKDHVGTHSDVCWKHHPDCAYWVGRAAIGPDSERIREAEQVIADALDPANWQASPPYLMTSVRIAGRLRAAGLLLDPGKVAVDREDVRVTVHAWDDLGSDRTPADISLQLASFARLRALLSETDTDS